MQCCTCQAVVILQLDYNRGCGDVPFQPSPPSSSPTTANGGGVVTLASLLLRDESFNFSNCEGLKLSLQNIIVYAIKQTAHSLDRDTFANELADSDEAMVSGISASSE
jgi:hypothetical protein